MEFWSYQFFVKDVKKDRSIVTKGFLNSKDQLYKFCDLFQPLPEPITLLAQTNE